MSPEVATLTPDRPKSPGLRSLRPAVAAADGPRHDAHGAADEGGWVGRVVPMAAVGAAHLGLLWLITSTLMAPTPPVMPPALVGTLVSQPVTEPVPLPVEPVPKPQPKPQPKPTPRPVKPPPVAPPSEKAVSAPPPEPPPPAQAAEEAPPPGPSPAPAPPVEAKPAEAVVPPRSDAAHLNNPPLPYPAASRRLGEQGSVLLDVYILANGTVGEIKLKRSSGFPRLDQAALDAVRLWRFQPARRGSEPIPYWYVQPLQFSLDG